MTLPDFFTMINLAGIRLANLNGQLQIRGPAEAITPAIKAGAAEHKATILSMLPPVGQGDIPIPESSGPVTEAVRLEKEAALEAYVEERREREEIITETVERDAQAASTEAGADCKQALVDDYRFAHDWCDWRLEWQLHVGQLYLRMRRCADAAVVARLKLLTEQTPTTQSDWLLLGRQILDTEHELRQQGKLPDYPWPAK
jgi:hypothetical protein